MWPGLVSPSHLLAVRQILADKTDLSHWEREDVALGFDLAAWWLQFWADGRKDERTLVDPPTSGRQRVPVPTYTTWEAVLGLDQFEPEEERELSSLDVEEIAKDLLRSGDMSKLQAFLDGKL